MYSFGLPILNEIVAVMVMVCWVVGRGDIGPSAGLVDRSMEVIAYKPQDLTRSVNGSTGVIACKPQELWMGVLGLVTWCMKGIPY